MDDEDYGALISSAYLAIDFSGILGFPNYQPYLHGERYSQAPTFYGDGDSAICHIIFVFSFMTKLNILHKDNLMQIFAHSLKNKAWTWLCGLPNKFITSHGDLCAMFFERWHDGEGDMMTVVERTLTYLNEIKEPMTSIVDEDTQDDPIEELQEEPMIENIVEDSPHVTIDENIEDLRYSQVCCNADIFPESPLEEPTEQHILSDPIEYVQKVSLIEDSIEDPFHDIITEAYKKLMIRSVWCVMTLDLVLHIMMTVWKVYCLMTFFLKKMSMKMRTSITWSMTQVTKTPLSPTKILMRSPRNSWKIQYMT